MGLTSSNPATGNRCQTLSCRVFELQLPRRIKHGTCGRHQTGRMVFFSARSRRQLGAPRPDARASVPPPPPPPPPQKQRKGAAAAWDAARAANAESRDFTANALFWDPIGNVLLDYLGVFSLPWDLSRVFSWGLGSVHVSLCKLMLTGRVAKPAADLCSTDGSDRCLQPPHRRFMTGNRSVFHGTSAVPDRQPFLLGGQAERRTAGIGCCGRSGTRLRTWRWTPLGSCVQCAWQLVQARFLTKTRKNLRDPIMYMWYSEGGALFRGGASRPHILCRLKTAHINRC